MKRLAYLLAVVLVLLSVFSFTGLASANGGDPSQVCEPATVLRAIPDLKSSNTVVLSFTNVDSVSRGPYQAQVYAYPKDDPTNYTITETFTIPQLVPGGVYSRTYSVEPFIPLGQIDSWFRYLSDNCNRVRLAFYRVYFMKVEKHPSVSKSSK